MAEDWDFYECHVDDVPSFVLVDLGLREVAPLPGRRYSVRVVAPLLRAQPDGLITSEEGEALRALEDDLVRALAAEADAVYVGRVTGGGQRRFYFYAAHVSGLGAALGRVQASHADYALEAGQFDDPGWRQYLDFLAPNALGWQYILNRRLLDHLGELGDAGGVRDVDHLARFAEEESARAFAPAIRAQGFEVREVQRSADHPAAWSVAFVGRHRARLEDMNTVTYRLVRLCEEFCGEYDGWGCNAQLLDDSPD